MLQADKLKLIHRLTLKEMFLCNPPIPLYMLRYLLDVVGSIAGEIQSMDVSSASPSSGSGGEAGKGMDVAKRGR